MVPDHIDNLPRRDDDNRQLMLGLIDDLPQERRGTRQLMMWGVGPRSRSRAVCRSSLGDGAKLVIDDPNHAHCAMSARRIAVNIAKLPELLLK